MSTLPHLHRLYAAFLLHDTWGSPVDWIFMAIKYLCRSLSLAHSYFFLQRCSSRSPWLIFYWLITQNSSSFDGEPSSWLPAMSWQDRDKECCSQCEIDWLSSASERELGALSWEETLGDSASCCFKRKRSVSGDVKRLRSSAAVSIWFRHLLGPEAQKLTVAIHMAEGVKTPVFPVVLSVHAQGRTNRVLITNERWPFEILHYFTLTVQT